MSKFVLTAILGVVLAGTALGLPVVDGGFIPWAIGIMGAGLVWTWLAQKIRAEGLLASGVFVLLGVIGAVLCRNVLAYEDGYDISAAFALGVVASYLGGLFAPLFGGSRARAR